MRVAFNGSEAQQYFSYQIPTSERFKRLVIETFTFPDTYYNIFREETVIFQGVDIVVPPGRYTETQLSGLLCAQMSVISGVTFTPVFNNITKVVSFETLTPGAYNLTLPQMVSKYYGLGYRVNTIATPDNFVLGVANFNRTNTFRIYSEAHGATRSYSVKETANLTIVRDDMLMLGVIPNQPYSQYLGNNYVGIDASDLRSFTSILITDDLGFEIDPNGSYWSLVISMF